MITKPESITLERTYRASLVDVWDLWTTKDGIESWWGPEGFTVTVRKLELRPGGELLYAMTATAPPQIAFMKQAGMPLTTETRITYTDVSAPRRLAYITRADFIPGVTPYDVTTAVELQASGDAVRMVLTIDRMHDEVWTQRAVMGWESELGKLAAVIDQTPRRPIMIKKVAFTMYPIEDTARARAFYEGTLGLTVGSHAANGVWTEYDLPGGGCLALFRNDDIKPSAAAGGSVALEVENLDALSARLKTQGVRFKAENIQSPVCRMTVILDSEGNSIILHQLHPR